MADYFEWLDSYSVGVRTFDDAHKNLIGIINRVVTDCMENKPLSQMTDLLIDLIRYTRYHFRNEEELMKETGFDLFEQHQAHHDKLFDQVLQFTDDTFHGRIDKSEITQFLMDWLITHILEEDMKYKEHFGKLGIH
ncbi:MAG: bacteriohemerythrin [bacterium]